MDIIGTIRRKTKPVAVGVARQAREHASELMLAGGVIANGAAIFFACKATLKVDEVLEKRERQLEEVKDVAEELIADEQEDYGEQDLKQDLAIVNGKSWIALGKAYLPAGALWLLSLGLVAGSHIAMQNKVAMWMSAYSALDQAFSSYRERVREDQGAEKDMEYLMGKPEIDEDGELWYPEMPARYFRFFDQYNSPRLWTKSKAANRDQMRTCLAHLNRIMDEDGQQRIWLDKVMDEFDLKYDEDLPYPLARCMAVYKDELPEGPNGERMLTLGVYDEFNHEAWSSENSDNAKECAVMLDFSMFHFCAYDED